MSYFFKFVSILGTQEQCDCFIFPMFSYLSYLFLLWGPGNGKLKFVHFYDLFIICHMLSYFGDPEMGKRGTATPYWSPNIQEIRVGRNIAKKLAFFVIFALWQHVYLKRTTWEGEHSLSNETYENQLKPWNLQWKPMNILKNIKRIFFIYGFPKLEK